jgi:choline-sulfatase
VSAPDIVVFMTDQQRADQVGYRDPMYDTPSLDRLADSGVTFTNAYSASTTCVPARSALLTGVQPHRLATQVNGMALHEGSWTLPRALAAAGYQTALVGKMHFAPIHAKHGFEVMRTCEHLVSSEILTPDGRVDLDDYHDWLLAQGLDEYRRLPPNLPKDVAATISPTPARRFPYDADAHPTTWVVREAEAFLAARDRTRPMFLVVSFPHPHAPLDPPEPWASMYDPADIQLPARGFEVNALLPPPFLRALEPSQSRFQVRRVDDIGEAQIRSMLTKVRALVRQIDDGIGRLLDALPGERTLVWYTSDHGDYAGHRGLLQKVPWIPFDDLVRVPLIMAGPGVMAGRIVDDIVQPYDLVPTCLQAAGVELDLDQLDAHSLWPLARPDEPLAAERHAVFATTMGWPGVRIGSRKYIRHTGSGNAVLFDLAADPAETTNLLDDPQYRDDAFAAALALHWALGRGTPLLPTAVP